MITNRPVVQVQSQAINNKFAIPVGTNSIINYDKFLLDKRDLNCTNCKNGMKSMVGKRINEKTFNVPVMCTCVPYIQSEDSDGVEIVVYKGRRERWINGKRPEIYLSDEKVRTAANTAAKTTKAVFEGSNVINGKKFQFVRPPSMVPRSEFLSKSAPGMPITRPGEVPMEFTTQSNLPENPVYGQVTKKNLKKAVPAPQKHLQTLPNGNRVFVDDATFSKLGGQAITASSNANTTVVTVGKKSRGRPKKNAVPTSTAITEVTVAAGNPGNPVFTVTTATPVTTVVPKKRGRPPKNPQPTVVPVVMKAPVVSQPVAQPMVSDGKRKRGRPKKVMVN
jgi:hypothetical protein